MVTANDRRLYETAVKLASVSECRYKFGAILARGKVISMGVNILKTHPIMKRYGSHCISIHAEVKAIQNARTDVAGSTMYVARDSVNPDSMPCAVCMSIIIESGIHSIVYHNGKKLIKEKL